MQNRHKHFVERHGFAGEDVVAQLVEHEDAAFDEVRLDGFERDLGRLVDVEVEDGERDDALGVRLEILRHGLDGVALEEIVFFQVRDGVQRFLEGEDLVELVTDKATFNMPAPVSGVLKEVKRRSYFTKPSVEKRMKKIKAVRRAYRQRMDEAQA